MKTAFHYYSKADTFSGQKNAKALYKLGNFFFSGQGIGIVNKEKALYYYERAAELGDSDAQNRLGELYEKGQDIGKDLKSAEQWYKKGEQ